jgi:hypothetical protein
VVADQELIEASLGQALLPTLLRHPPAHSPAINAIAPWDLILRVLPPDRRQLLSRFRACASNKICGHIDCSMTDQIRCLSFAPLKMLTWKRWIGLRPAPTFTSNPIVVGGIRVRPIERDQGWKFNRQALFDISRAFCGDIGVFLQNGLVQ